MLLYCILTLFGSFLLYREVRSDGCDPSASNPDTITCGTSGAGVFGAMLGKQKSHDGKRNSSLVLQGLLSLRKV